MDKGFGSERYRKLIGLLVEQRRALGYSQAQLAARLGTHQQFVSRYETGERRLDVAEFCEVAAVLQLDAIELLKCTGV
ncbi:MAG: helix-turn-helix domain-containing protein [Novosphingobium sp.]|uniref:helix-turn-helix domain-containing protein n=1 Tax=Novosphingobium sp. TaxID=1874826 RepID=UPI003B9C7D9A